jgi:hypothetical protein
LKNLIKASIREAGRLERPVKLNYFRRVEFWLPRPSNPTSE